MRTTLDIDDDLLLAAKEIARRERRSAGRVVSDLLRQAMTQSTAASPAAAENRVEQPSSRYGFEPFPNRGGVVTNELIDRIREETGD